MRFYCFSLFVKISWPILILSSTAFISFAMSYKFMFTSQIPLFWKTTDRTFLKSKGNWNWMLEWINFIYDWVFMEWREIQTKMLYRTRCMERAKQCNSSINERLYFHSEDNLLMEASLLLLTVTPKDFAGREMICLHSVCLIKLGMFSQTFIQIIE